jgi:hypothetical protein
MIIVVNEFWGTDKKKEKETFDVKSFGQSLVENDLHFQ